MAPDLMYIFALCPPSCKTEARSVDAALRRKTGVALDHAVLHLDGTAYGIHHAAKLDDASIAGALHHTPVMHGYGGIDQVAPLLASASPRTSSERLIVLLCLAVARSRASVRSSSEPASLLYPATSAARMAASFRVSAMAAAATSPEPGRRTQRGTAGDPARSSDRQSLARPVALGPHSLLVINSGDSHWRLDSGVTELKFKIGQLVYFHPKAAARPQLDVVPGPYVITRRLPAAEDGEFQYEIRNTLEEYNRVARESELTRV
jgi:hypothetical protein